MYFDSFCNIAIIMLATGTFICARFRYVKYSVEMYKGRNLHPLCSTDRDPWRAKTITERHRPYLAEIKGNYIALQIVACITERLLLVVTDILVHKPNLSHCFVSQGWLH